MLISNINENTLKKTFVFNKILLFLFVCYFCLPKIGFVSVDKFEIRLLDILSVFIALIVSSKIKLKGDHILYLCIFFAIQVCIGLFYSGIVSLLYLFRFFQYMFLGYGFFLLMTSKYKKYFFCIFFAIQLPLCLFQFFGYLPNYDPGRGLIYSSEFSGTFGTPAEFSYFLIAIVAIFMNLGVIKHISFSIFPIFSSVAFAAILMIISSFKKLILIVPKFLIIFVPYLIIFGMVLFFIDIDEIRFLLSDPGFDSSKLTKGESFNVDDFSGPITLIMRSVKFIDTMVFILNNYFVLFFGCGYGCGYGAMDSGIIRLILEFGILFTLITFFLSKKISTYLLFVLITINFLFDGFWSSHVAPVLFAGIFFNLSLSVHSKKKVIN